MPKCSQCEKPAIVSYGDIDLCVEHHLMMQQAMYLQASILAANLNFVRGELNAALGGLIQSPRIEIPPPPFIGDKLTLNNINVTNSTFGAINTGTIRNLDASITLMRSKGDDEIAAGIKELTEAILDSNEINQDTQKELAEQLEFLVSQVTSEAKNRSMGVVKSVLAGIRDTIATAASLIVVWDKVEPLILKAVGFN